MNSVYTFVQCEFSQGYWQRKGNITREFQLFKPKRLWTGFRFYSKTEKINAISTHYQVVVVEWISIDHIEK